MDEVIEVANSRREKSPEGDEKGGEEKSSLRCGAGRAVIQLYPLAAVRVGLHPPCSYAADQNASRQ